MANRVAVLGSGVVGEVLANGFLAHDYDVMRGSRSPAKLAGWRQTAGERAAVGSFAEAAQFGDLVTLAVKGLAAEAVVDLCGPENLAGKTVIDTTNPIADAPPENGVLRFGVMVNPDFGALKPTMFVCGDSAAAKQDVQEVLTLFGWEWEDLGGVQAARAIEPLCILWCIPGFLRNRWTHAFKLLGA